MKNSDRAAIHRELEAFAQPADEREHMQAHMVRLFEEVLAFKPQLIVELGVGWGCSNFALGKGAELCGARMISVDIKACERIYKGVEFVQSDDIEYAEAWTLGRSIDLLMLDTSHTYDQTQAEVAAWFPHLNERCRVIFHDTNAQPHFEAVARYLRDWLAIPFPEEDAFEIQAGDWYVRHYPVSFGLTILDRGAGSG